MTLALVASLAAILIIALLVQRTPADATTFVSLYGFLLLVVPARYVIGQLGSIASPATMVGLGALVLWVLRRLHHPVTWIDRRPNPVRTALGMSFAYALLSSATASLRLLDEFEMSGISLTLVAFLSGIGIAFLLADTTRSVDRLEVFVDRVLLFGAVSATFGLVQFVVSVDLGSFFALEPFLTSTGNADFSRATFRRPSGTALHPIAFAVAMASLLPLALHRFFYRPDRTILSRGLPLLLISTAIPLSLSRSAFVAGGVGVLTLVVIWPNERRINVAAIGSIGIASTVFVPGLAGTLRDLFLGAADTPEIQGRLRDLPVVEALFEASPIVGRGFGTYTADGYRLLDNDFFGLLIEVGLLGVGVFAIVVAVVVHAANAPRRRGAPDAVVHLSYAFLGSFLAAVSSIFTFDTFFYRTVTGLLLIATGAIAALWRLTGSRGPAAPARRAAGVVRSAGTGGR